MADIDFDELDSSFERTTVNSSKTTEQKQWENKSVNVDNNKKELMKIAIAGLSIGLVLIFGTIAFVSNSGKPSEDSNKIIHEVTPEEQGNDAGDKGDGAEEDSTKTSERWVAFDNGRVNFSEEKIESVFRIVSIEHFVNTDKNNEYPQLKTILTGTLAGFGGKYELELPYSKGCRLSDGIEFDVQIEVGWSGNRKVIGSISY